MLYRLFELNMSVFNFIFIFYQDKHIIKLKFVTDYTKVKTVDNRLYIKSYRSAY